MHKFGLIVFVMVLAGLAPVGCTSTAGTNYQQERITEITVGETTEADLVEIFGPPTGRSSSSDGRTHLQWSYHATRIKPGTNVPIVSIFTGGVDTGSKTLMVALGPDGTVESYHTSEGGNKPDMAR